MTKQELIRAVRERTGVETAVVSRVVESFMGVVSETLESGEPVILRGFGSFQVKQRAQKVARDMSKGQPIVIPAHSVPVFKPSRTLVDRIKNSSQLSK